MERVGSLKNFFKNKNIGFVCNNVGGGYVIKYLIKKYQLKSKILVRGSSKKIFKKIKSQKDFFGGLNLLICSTSTPGDFEIRKMLIARKKGIKTIFILDHWTNYKKRFIYKNSYFYPDEIWCGDKYSYSLAKKILKKKNIKLFKNPIFEYYEKIGKKQKITKKNNILYVSSNFLRMPMQINENIIFQRVLKIYNKHKFDLVYFRPHPSDNLNIVPSGLNDINCKIDNNDELYKILGKVKLVIGSNSASLVLAKIFGCKTINILPKNMKNTLPKIFIDELIKIEDNH